MCLICCRICNKHPPHPFFDAREHPRSPFRKCLASTAGTSVFAPKRNPVRLGSHALKRLRMFTERNLGLAASRRYLLRIIRHSAPGETQRGLSELACLLSYVLPPGPVRCHRRHSGMRRPELPATSALLAIPGALHQVVAHSLTL